MAMTLAERVGERRAVLRKAGLRPVQIWVPDPSAPASPKNVRASRV